MTSSFHIALWWLGHHVNVLKLMKPSKIDKNYSCATRSSLTADRFHCKTSGSFAFTWYRCEISYRSEILASVQHRGELTPVWLAPVWHFVVVSCKQTQSHEREPKWTRAGLKFVPVSRKHPPKTKLSERTLNWPEKILHSYTYQRHNYSSCQFV